MSPNFVSFWAIETIHAWPCDLTNENATHDILTDHELITIAFPMSGQICTTINIEMKQTDL